MKILEVGSGHLPTHKIKAGDSVIHLDVNKAAQFVEVIGDGYRLPFVDNSFELVYCSHVLEHVDNPLSMLKELHRVSSHKVEVRVPNASFYKFYSGDEMNEHIYSWNFYAFGNFLSQVFDSFMIEESQFFRCGKWQALFWRFTFGLFYRNNEIRATCYK